MRRSLLHLLSALAWFTSLAGTPAETNVWMLTPGFVTRELPVRVSNINNLRFAPDGRLTALGYDGRIHLLRDSDGDGLEDEDALFWDKPTLSVPVGMAWSKDGLYVSSHGKISLLRDTDGDWKADVEEIVANGWPATDVASGGVDATAITLDQEGNIYFGLLTADYSNPYRVKDGISRYDVNGPRGTIQKWSAQTKRLETIATGIRVPYTLAFNRTGDLFVTDQEGETWCPNGNPLDELNHIIPGRNYGFPPRHEKYLPGLISEPPVVAFAPQHQSTCGLVFNESRPGHKSFGPTWWNGDAFVAGESRGKIWRVRLVKTPAGYVGKEMLIARLNMLTTDVAISPQGDLYAACHSGPPDWGTGPKGEGKLFKITYSDVKAPQPVAIWASGPMQVNVAFDKAIDPKVTNGMNDMTIDLGEYVSAADHLESLKPPYKVVAQQEAAHRGKLRVVSAGLSPDRRTLVLTTDPHPLSVRYALSLPAIAAVGASTRAATVDLGYDLSGVEANWFEGANSKIAKWSGWLPHVDSDLNAALTIESAEHAELLKRIQQKGRLQLRSQIKLPRGSRLRFQNSLPFELTLGSKTMKAQLSPSNQYSTEALLEDDRVTVALNLETGRGNELALHASYSSANDSTERPLPLSSLLVPWAPPNPTAAPLREEAMEITGGDYEKGRDLFFGEQLKCATCHRLRGEGGTVGPDLSNLVHRDIASVLRDIKEPNAAINPDYVSYNVRLRDGAEFNGFVRAQTADLLRVVGADNKEHLLSRNMVSDLRPSAVSLMPSGLLDAINAAQIKDLLTFISNEPPTRSPEEIAAVLKMPARRATAEPEEAKPLNIVLVASKQDHGPGQHDYPAWQKKWPTLLGQVARVSVSSAWEWPSDEQWRNADVVIFYFWNHDWSAERYRQVDAYQARGGGVVLFHSATIADKEPEKLAERIGLAAQPGPTKYLHTPFMLEFGITTNQAITDGFKQLKLLDEPYWPMIGDQTGVEVLATAEVEGQPRPLIWTFQKGKGRVFASIPGHYSWTFDDPLFRALALRGVAWVAGQSDSRFDGQ